MQPVNELGTSSHLDAARLMDHVLDGSSLSEPETAHLATCQSCRLEREALQSLAAELRVFALSEVPDATLARYDTLLAAAQPARESSLQRVARWVTGQLLFDSRAQALAAGVRNLAGTSYRLLYAAGEAEVELLIEEEQGARRIEGELVGAVDGPVLVQLYPSAPTHTPHELQETLGSDSGRFRFVGVRSGRYTLTFAMPDGETVHLPDVEIA